MEDPGGMDDGERDDGGRVGDKGFLVDVVESCLGENGLVTGAVGFYVITVAPSVIDVVHFLRREFRLTIVPDKPMTVSMDPKRFRFRESEPAGKPIHIYSVFDYTLYVNEGSDAERERLLRELRYQPVLDQ